MAWTHRRAAILTLNFATAAGLALALAPAGACGLGLYSGPEHLIDSHCFTADPAECSSVGDMWTLQSATAFWIEVPTPDGNRRDGTLPVFRFFLRTSRCQPAVDDRLVGTMHDGQPRVGRGRGAARTARRCAR